MALIYEVFAGIPLFHLGVADEFVVRKEKQQNGEVIEHLVRERGRRILLVNRFANGSEDEQDVEWDGQHFELPRGILTRIRWIPGPAALYQGTKG